MIWIIYTQNNYPLVKLGWALDIHPKPIKRWLSSTWSFFWRFRWCWCCTENPIWIRWLWLEGCECKMLVRSGHRFGLLPIIVRSITSSIQFYAKHSIRASGYSLMYLLSTLVLSINLFACIKIKRKWQIRHKSRIPMPARTNGNFRSAVTKVVNAVH